MGNCCSTKSYEDEAPNGGQAAAPAPRKKPSAAPQRKDLGRILGGQVVPDDAAASPDARMAAAAAAQKRQEARDAGNKSGKLGKQLANEQRIPANRRTEAHVVKKQDETGLDMRWD